MRIIAGCARGLRLEAPQTAARPTMDRVKAAIFSSLGESVPNAEVLDLFAGSGALGIESLSRGARSAVFVDHDRLAITAIERNLAKGKLRGKILREDVFRFLARAQSDSFDLIFADPPYGKMPGGESFTELLLRNERMPFCLRRNGIFILEKRASEKFQLSNFWSVLRRKPYGATETIFFQRSDSISE